MTTQPNEEKLHGLSLCSGVGGLELGLDLAFAGRHRTICCCEWEGYAASTLVARMDDASLDKAVIWDDITTFDGKPWRGKVDILSAGFPCQPFSVAGKRLGEDDERHLWPDVVRVIGEVGPALCFLENVPGLITTRTLRHRGDLCALLDGLDEGIARAANHWHRSHLRCERKCLYRGLLKRYGISALLLVCCDLERIGYTVEWGTFSAGEVGAPHGRKRVFILGVRNGGGELADAEHEPGRAEHGDESGGRRKAGTKHATELGLSGGELEDAGGPERGSCESRGHERDGHDAGREEASSGFRAAGTGLAAPLLRKRHTVNSLYAEHGMFPPGPDDTGGWEAITELVSLAPALPSVADLREYASAHEGEVESYFHNVADGLAYRVDQLRCTGNGVVPLVAAKAFVVLASRVVAGVVKEKP